MSGSSSAIADIGQSRRAASSAQAWRMEAPSCRSCLRRLWLAGAEGEEARAGWFGLLRQDQLVCLGDEQPVFLAVMEDHDFPASAEEIRADDTRGHRRSEVCGTKGPHVFPDHGWVGSGRGTPVGVRRPKSTIPITRMYPTYTQSSGTVGCERYPMRPERKPPATLLSLRSQDVFQTGSESGRSPRPWRRPTPVAKSPAAKMTTTVMMSGPRSSRGPERKVTAMPMATLSSRPTVPPHVTNRKPSRAPTFSR